MKHPTTVERKSDRELVVTRTFNAPAHIVFEARTLLVLRELYPSKLDQLLVTLVRS